MAATVYGYDSYTIGMESKRKCKSHDGRKKQYKNLTDLIPDKLEVIL